MKYLVPMFELDPLLPRTLMAVMSPCHLRELFNKKVFAPEICLANLSFFMKIDKYFPRHVKVRGPFTLYEKSEYHFFVSQYPVILKMVISGWYLIPQVKT